MKRKVRAIVLPLPTEGSYQSQEMLKKIKEALAERISGDPIQIAHMFRHAQILDVEIEAL
ncbi:MAG: hypothetical protein ABFE07_29370 [Armatimonadia bacterium]